MGVLQQAVPVSNNRPESMSNSTDVCSQYGSGWCCTSTAEVVTILDYDITIFSLFLSIVISIMLAFVLFKIGRHYYYLHNPPGSPKEEKLVKGPSTITDSATNSKYLTFAEHVQPPASPASLNAPDRIYTSDADLSMEEPHSQGENDTFSADYIMELPDRQHSSSLIQVYRQYEKQLGVGSKFLEKRDKQTPKPTMRGFHFIYLLLLGAWLLVQCVVLLTKSPTSTTARILDGTLYITHAFLDNLIIAICFFPSDNRKYVLLSIAIVFVFVVLASITAIFYSFIGFCHQCSFFYPAPEAFFTYLVFILFYSFCLVIHYANRKRPRDTVVPWIWYLITIYLIAAVGSGIVYFGSADVGFCIVNFVMIIYATFTVPFLHRTLKADSDYLSSEENDYSKELNPLVARVYDNLKRHSVCWIPYEEIELKERLGLGAAGEVYKGLFLETPVAIKRLFDNQSQALEDFFKEVTLMSKLSHPNILLFIGVCVRDNGDRFIITEMMDRGSVFDLIHPNLSFSAIRDPEADNKLTARRIHRILLQCAQGMSYLHSFRPPIVHRDLKSHNLLVDHNWNVKVGDFGLSRPQSADLMTAAGTPQWTAPEVIRHDHYTTKADVYSFGIIIFEMLSGKIPYVDIGPLSAAHRVAYEGLRPEFPNYCDPNYVSFAQECWRENPEERPDFTVVVSRLQKMIPPMLPKVD